MPLMILYIIISLALDSRVGKSSDVSMLVTLEYVEKSLKQNLATAL